MVGNLSLPGFSRTHVRHARNFLVFAALVLTAFGSSAHDTANDGDPENDWIQGLANAEGSSCCGHNDCYPIPANDLEISGEGVFRVEIAGRWFTVAEPNLLRDSSPDGRPWVCPKQEPAAGGFMYTVRGVRCLLVPMGS